jgi:2-dehydro-3-deoxyphosphogluconate aldolase/(4S)-4-hydroxy-2-oxoglutarate aldolase
MVVDKEQVISKITEGGLVAVVRAESSEQALRITEACIKGGVVGIEITFTVPGADQVIRDLVKAYGDGEIIIGAGTVMDSETARIAILAGAQYVVSPYLNLETVKLCNRYRIPCMPGAMSIKEVVEGMEAGADIIKVFPGELFGPKIIKAIRGPIPYAKLMPTGGVSVDNVEEWIKAGAVAVGVGSALTKGAKTGDYEAITKTAQEFISKIKAARGQK